MDVIAILNMTYKLTNPLCNSTSGMRNGNVIPGDAYPCTDTNTSTASIALDNIKQSQLSIVFMKQLEAMNLRALKAITSCIYLTGFVANVLLLCYIVKFKRYRSPTFVIILSLACCDVGVCLGGWFFTVVVLPVVNGPGWFCPLGIYISTAFSICSVCHMVVFSILRFYQLVFPLAAYSKVTVSFVTKICAVIWPVAMTSIIFVYTYFKPVTFSYEGNMIVICDFDPDLRERQLFTETTFLLFPNITIFSFHLIKHIAVRQQGQKTVSETDEQKGSRQTTNARAVTLVILAFCLTSMPQLIHTYIHRVFGVPYPSFHLILETITLNLIYMNSPLNPFIYVFCASSVRKDVFKMITCVTRK